MDDQLKRGNAAAQQSGRKGGYCAWRILKPREQTVDAVSRADSADAAMEELKATVARLSAGPVDDRPRVGAAGEVEVRTSRMLASRTRWPTTERCAWAAAW